MTDITHSTNDNGNSRIKNFTIKKNYSQNWSLYNLAQTKEKLLFLRIINDAVDYLDIPYKYKGNGRPHFLLQDMIKCCCIKVFNCFSSRRTISELQLAYALGYIKTIPHFNSINNYMNNPEITQYFEQLYKILAFPLVEVESIFAIDSTGFSLPHKVKWLEIRLKGKWRYSKDYKKLHIITGVNTNIVTAVKITEGYKHDIKEFEPLVRETAKKFRIKEICADTGYLSRKNCDIAHEIGAIPFILPKKDTRIKSRGSYNWLRMVRLWHDNLELFKQHYHKRSNVESTFSMIKRKFLSFVRSKTDIAQTNELLCKVICHNASVLVNSIFELGIELNFEDYYK